LTSLTFKITSRQYFCALLKHQPLSALFILIGISKLVAGSFLTAFLWSVKNGQFDDDYTPSIRILFDDTIESNTTTTSDKKKSTINKTTCR